MDPIFQCQLCRTDIDVYYSDRVDSPHHWSAFYRRVTENTGYDQSEEFSVPDEVPDSEDVRAHPYVHNVCWSVAASRPRMTTFNEKQLARFYECLVDERVFLKGLKFYSSPDLTDQALYRNDILWPSKAPSVRLPKTLASLTPELLDLILQELAYQDIEAFWGATGLAPSSFVWTKVASRTFGKKRIEGKTPDKLKMMLHNVCKLPPEDIPHTTNLLTVLENVDVILDYIDALGDF